MRNRTRLLLKRQEQFHAGHCNSKTKIVLFLLKTMTCLSFTLCIHWGHISLRSLYLLSQIIWIKLTHLCIDLSLGCICRAEKRSRFYMVKHQCFHFWETKGTIIGSHWTANLASINVRVLSEVSFFSQQNLFKAVSPYFEIVSKAFQEILVYSELFFCKQLRKI